MGTRARLWPQEHTPRCVCVEEKHLHQEYEARALAESKTRSFFQHAALAAGDRLARLCGPQAAAAAPSSPTFILVGPCGLVKAPYLRGHDYFGGIRRHVPATRQTAALQTLPASIARQTARASTVVLVEGKFTTFNEIRRSSLVYKRRGAWGGPDAQDAQACKDLKRMSLTSTLSGAERHQKIACTTSRAWSTAP